jgi:hypothetical protein
MYLPLHPCASPAVTLRPSLRLSGGATRPPEHYEHIPVPGVTNFSICVADPVMLTADPSTRTAQGVDMIAPMMHRGPRSIGLPATKSPLRCPRDWDGRVNSIAK